MAFQLQDYTEQIKKVTEANKVTVEQGVHYFTVNLSIMREFYTGASELNYRQLGQQWNKLTSRTKVEQKAETIKLLSTAKSRRIKEDL